MTAIRLASLVALVLSAASASATAMPPRDGIRMSDARNHYTNSHITILFEYYLVFTIQSLNDSITVEEEVRFNNRTADNPLRVRPVRHYVNTILDKLDKWVEILRDGNKHQGDDINELVYTVLTTQFVLTEQFRQDKAVFAEVGKVQERFSFWLTYIMPTLLDRLNLLPLPDDLHHMDIDTPPHNHAHHHRSHHNAMRPSEMRARCQYAARQAHEVWLRLLGDYLADSTISEDEPEEPVGFFNLYKYANKTQLVGYLGSLMESPVLVAEEDGRRAAIERLKAIQNQVHLHPGEAPSTPT
ncbi:unnamed protein product [Vitrella brassicaformis CCMP3155]|uniref:Uncharacterized protein n=1 Tax=Vitrella brassicaformis (strain CCMP3155) TaxID=1169540 RepID=A0A0G4F9W8_VITBC|nr:unnamed protein product [Vitrella brassicaformis CCMP3155]|eukprot:CEM09165.1 unnamed protein product [Vitrella brassicaformis CCMP3155]